MKAWQVFEHGEPAEVLRLSELEMPEPGPGQLLVRVRAAALNFPDVLLCRGQYQIRPPLPFTPPQLPIAPPPLPIAPPQLPIAPPPLPIVPPPMPRMKRA